MKVAVGLRRVAAGKRTSGRRAAQIAVMLFLYHDKPVLDKFNWLKYNRFISRRVFF